MVVISRKIMEAPACNSRNGWRSSPVTSPPRCGRLDTINDAWVRRTPVIVPCYNGKKLQIHEELVVNGLSAISIRHHKGNCDEIVAEVPVEERPDDEKKAKEGSSEKVGRDLKMCSTTGLPVCLGERMKRRNSFWNMHRPDLSKLTWPQNFVSPIMLRDFFHHHLRTHGTFCEPLHVSSRNSHWDEEMREWITFRELVPPTVLPPDEKATNIMEKSRSVQLNDEDLDPEIMVHKSRAEFCVTIGEYAKRPLLKRSASCQVQKTGQSEIVTGQHDGASREELNAKENASSVIDSPAGLTEVQSGQIKDGVEGNNWSVPSLPPSSSEWGM